MTRILFSLLMLVALNVEAQKKPQVAQLDAAAFFAALNETPNILILDVRPFDNFEQNRIAGAVWMEGGKSLSNMADTTDKETPVLVYCQVGKRSRAASEELLKLGFKKISHLQYGLDDYLAKGYAIDTAKWQPKP